METVEGHRTAAEQALRQGRAKSALDEARAALRLQPQDGQAMGLAALAFSLMGDVDEARREIGDALEVAPLDSKVRYLAYLVLGRLRDAVGARTQLTYFAEMEPENLPARALLARFGGPLTNLPPLPRPASDAVWYDGTGHALSDSHTAGVLAEGAEPPPGPDVMVCPDCEKRTYKGWVCGQCGVPLPRPV
jgi:tetratricopeptide (TPR) repeat protein